MNKIIRSVHLATKAKVLMNTMSSRDTDEILFRIREVDLTVLKFAKSVYEGFQRIQLQTGSSLNYYCKLLSVLSKSRAPSYYKNWYNIYRHFCVRSRMDIDELIGIDYKKLKFISESSLDIFDPTTTRDVVNYLKKSLEPETKKWEYLKDFKERKKNGYSPYSYNVYDAYEE